LWLKTTAYLLTYILRFTKTRNSCYEIDIS
jgi:hypothetical protein